MNPRIIEFITGIETSPQPNPGTPTNPADIISLNYLETYYSQRRVEVGSISAPVDQDATESIEHTLTDTQELATVYLQNDAVATGDMSSVNPQLAVPTKIGQRVTLYFTSDTQRIKLSDGNGLRMKNGDFISLNNSQIEFEAISLTEWAEISRNGVGDV